MTKNGSSGPARESARLRKQRELVTRLQRQLAFERLVLERLEGREHPSERAERPRSIADVAAIARRRDVAPPD